MIWIQVPDVHAEHARLGAAGVPIIRGPVTEPWGLIEMWIQDPDASRSSWSRFPPITLCAATRDRRHHQADELYAAIEDVYGGSCAGYSCICSAVRALWR
jgi:hypothetical protein